MVTGASDASIPTATNERWSRRPSRSGLGISGPTRSMDAGLVKATGRFARTRPPTGSGARRSFSTTRPVSYSTARGRVSGPTSCRRSTGRRCNGPSRTRARARPGRIIGTCSAPATAGRSPPNSPAAVRTFRCTFPTASSRLSIFRPAVTSAIASPGAEPGGAAAARLFRSLGPLARCVSAITAASTTSPSATAAALAARFSGITLRVFRKSATFRRG